MMNNDVYKRVIPDRKISLVLFFLALNNLNSFDAHRASNTSGIVFALLDMTGEGFPFTPLSFNSLS